MGSDMWFYYTRFKREGFKTLIIYYEVNVPVLLKADDTPLIGLD